MSVRLINNKHCTSERLSAELPCRAVVAEIGFRTRVSLVEERHWNRLRWGSAAVMAVSRALQQKGSTVVIEYQWATNSPEPEKLSQSGVK